MSGALEHRHTPHSGRSFPACRPRPCLCRSGAALQSHPCLSRSKPCLPRSRPCLLNSYPVYADSIPVCTDHVPVCRPPSLFTMTLTLFNSIPALFTQAPILVCRVLKGLGQASPQSSFCLPGLSPVLSVLHWAGWEVLSVNQAKSVPYSSKVVAPPLTSTKRLTICSWWAQRRGKSTR